MQDEDLQLGFISPHFRHQTNLPGGSYSSAPYTGNERVCLHLLVIDEK